MRNIKKTESGRTILDFVSCDLCRNPIPSVPDHKINEVIILHQKGTFSSFSTDGECYNPDLCPDCFASKIFPLFKQLGIKTEYEAYHY
jgi:hypothetical protein